VFAIWRDADLWVNAQVADQLYFIQSFHAFLLLSSWLSKKEEPPRSMGALREVLSVLVCVLFIPPFDSGF
jgi:hypothetical protein